MRLSEMIRILHLSESFEKMGFTKQEFDAESEELVDVEEEPSEEEPVFAGESAEDFDEE